MRGVFVPYQYQSGRIWEVAPCPKCRGTGWVGPRRCFCANGILGRDVTCTCVKNDHPIDDCDLCRGSGVRDVGTPVRPHIVGLPLWWKTESWADRG